jgi:carboxypeptidase Q
MKCKAFTAVAAMLFAGLHAFAQQGDSAMMRTLYDEILLHAKAYDNLAELTHSMRSRLSGSPGAAQAVLWARQKMQEAGADTVWLQEVWVPHWVRGEKEKGTIIQSDGVHQDVPLCALGMSVATPEEGITAPVIEVTDFKQLEELGEKNIRGRIVFYNHPFDQRRINTFDAYGEAGIYRYYGASEAARYGAVATILRSLSSSDNDYPHTGAQRYKDSIPQIPCAAISTNAANLLSRILKADPSAQFYLRQRPQMLDSVLSYNVIGEMKGKSRPDEIVVAGGHLDAWETGQGAHDDGAGVVQCIEIIRTFRALDIRPERTIRIVAFMNEENGLKGGRTYAREAERKREIHVAALESDAGGFTPNGFGLNMDSARKANVLRWKPLFLPYNIWQWEGDEDGADISPLTNGGKVPGIGLQVDSQRYFDVHHAATDVFSNVNRRELHLGAAAMASLVYLLSRYGL